MPPTLYVIFLLLFAALAFGWFYWQRAKSRSADATTTKTTTESTDSTSSDTPPS